MKKVLFISALPTELKSIKEKVKSIYIKDLKIDFLISWVWSYNSIYNIKDYLDKNPKPDFIVNIWVCWINKEFYLESLAFFQVYRIKNSSNNREELVPIFIDYWSLESILCSEEVITSTKSIWKEKFVDMESYGISLVCSKESIPYILLKVPFDFVSLESKKVDISKLKDSLNNIDYKDLLWKINSYISEKSENLHTNIDFYSDFFKLTFSETEILKKILNKFIAYKLDFRDFFEKNKNLNKKDFLKLSDSL